MAYFVEVAMTMQYFSAVLLSFVVPCRALVCMWHSWFLCSRWHNVFLHCNSFSEFIVLWIRCCCQLNTLCVNNISILLIVSSLHCWSQKEICVWQTRTCAPVSETQTMSHIVYSARWQSCPDLTLQMMTQSIGWQTLEDEPTYERRTTYRAPASGNQTEVDIKLYCQ